MDYENKASKILELMKVGESDGEIKEAIKKVMREVENCAKEEALEDFKDNWTEIIDYDAIWEVVSDAEPMRNEGWD